VHLACSFSTAISSLLCQQASGNGAHTHFLPTVFELIVHLIISFMQKMSDFLTTYSRLSPNCQTYIPSIITAFVSSSIQNQHWHLASCHHLPTFSSSSSSSCQYYHCHYDDSHDFSSHYSSMHLHVQMPSLIWLV